MSKHRSVRSSVKSAERYRKSYLSLSDLADLGTVMGNVYHTKDDMIDCVNAFYEGMVTRSEEMKLHPNYHREKLCLSGACSTIPYL